MLVVRHTWAIHPPESTAMATARIASPASTSFPTTIHVPGTTLSVEPVEVLVLNGVEEILPTYLRPSSDLLSIDASLVAREKQIPIIDLAGLDGDESERKNVMARIAFACEEWGFFQIINHGIPQLLMDQMMAVAKDFFSLPLQEKVAYTAMPGLVTQGYGSKYIAQEDAIRDWRDYLYLHLQPLSVRQYEYWPTEPALFREILDEYSLKLKKLAQKLLAIFSQNLDLPSSFLESALVEPHQKMLINFYPPCPQPDKTAGFHNHSDIGAVTLVMQEEGIVGLQVRKDGEWIPVEPERGAFVVNVADQVEILSNGRYKSVEHRVVTNRHRARISIPVFFDGAPEAKIAPARELLSKECPQLYKEIKFDDHEVTFYTYGANGKTHVQSYIMSS